jgi:hypothetical protein
MTEKQVENTYKLYDDTTMGVDVRQRGVYFPLLTNVLNDLGIGTWKYARPAAHEIPDFLLEKLQPDVLGLGPVNTMLRGYPIVLDVDWGGMWKHVVVLDTITKVPLTNAWWLSICDPADGDVHISRMERGKPISYEGRRVTWSMNFGSDPTHDYPAGKTAQGNVTKLIYCETPAEALHPRGIITTWDAVVEAMHP